MRKLTSQMTKVELARIIAGHMAWQGKRGGWIYDADGKAIAHGWTKLANELIERGALVVGRGINWHALRIVRIGK